MRAISKRVVIASVPLVSLFMAALDPTPRPALAVNEFASPPTAQPRARQVLKTGIQERRVLRAPDLIGQQIGTARATLESRGLHAGREQSRSATEHRPGTVLAQDPKPGASVEPGSAINLWVAAAPPRTPDRGASPLEPPRPPRGVLVPDLIHRPALTAGTLRARPSDIPAGTVLTQSPNAGTRTRPGTAVDVAIAIAIPAPVPPAVPAAPVVPPPVAVTPPPLLVAQPAPDPRSARWPRRLAWGLGSALLLTAGGAVYYRRATLGTGQQPVTLPTLAFGPHWDTGTQRIGPAGPLRNGSGLRLVSGLEMGTSNIEDDHLVGAAHDTGGLRR